MLKKAQETEYRIDRTLFDDLVETLEIGSLCALGGGLPLPVKMHCSILIKSFRYILKNPDHGYSV